MTLETVLQQHIPGVKCSFVRTVESAVTTAWGVRWNEMQIARDVLQNFYDANRHELHGVEVTLHERDVRVSGPAAFDVERLFYLGSEKTVDDIGQYGEGFKAAATCLLRDHGVTPICISGATLVHVRLASAPVSQTRLHPLVYDFYSITSAPKGALLILPSCSPVLARELQQGMTHFFFEENPLLSGRIWESLDHNYALYHANGADGHIFYCRLKRATIAGLPIIPVIHKANARIEKKIQRDRDRNAFEDSVLDLCYDTFAKPAANSELPVLAILKASAPFWERGHPLLSALAAKRPHGRVRGEIRALFKGQYYAASIAHEGATQLRYEQIEAVWRGEGRRKVPTYFIKFGVPSAGTHLEGLRTKTLAEEQRKARGLTAPESRSIQVLQHALNDLAPLLAALLARKQVRYSVADTQTIMGALVAGRGYQSLDVFLAAVIFIGEFAYALAAFLHEHVHIFGYDGSRGFTDALTEVIEAVVRHRTLLDSYERDWETARAGVVAERGTVVPDIEDSLATRLRRLDRDGLLRVLEQIPGAIIRPLLQDNLSSPPHSVSDGADRVPEEG